MDGKRQIKLVMSDIENSFRKYLVYIHLDIITYRPFASSLSYKVCQSQGIAIKERFTVVNNHMNTIFLNVSIILSLNAI